MGVGVGVGGGVDGGAGGGGGGGGGEGGVEGGGGVGGGVAVWCVSDPDARQLLVDFMVGLGNPHFTRQNHDFTITI